MQPVGSTDNLPQIPEPDGSYMLNQKFVIPIYKKSAGICTCYSSHTSKGVFVKVKGARDRRVVISLQGVIAMAMATLSPDLIEVIEEPKKR